MEYIRSEANSLGALNLELEKIETTLATKLSTEESGPRVMLADLDMNSNQLLNLPMPVDPTDPVRLTDFKRLILEEITNVKIFATMETLIPISQSDHGKHYVTLSSNDVTFVVDKAESVNTTGVSVLVFITQLGSGTVRLTPASGVTLVYPEDSAPTAYDKGSTLSLLAVTNDKWVLAGNLGY